MVIQIFDNDVVTCDLDDTLPVLRHRWKRETSGDGFAKNLLHILEEYKTLRHSYATLAWLADTTLLGELDEETERWLADVWEEKIFAKGGVKIHAVILGNNIFADYPMEQFKTDAEQKFNDFDVQLGVFSNQQEAYKWIRQQQIQLKQTR
jgi:hypothetical protein